MPVPVDLAAVVECRVPVATRQDLVMSKPLMRVLELQPHRRGILIGRVLDEALQGSAVPGGAARRCLAMSGPAADGRRTLLEYQRLDGRLYLDQAQFRPAAAGESAGCR